MEILVNDGERVRRFKVSRGWRRAAQATAAALLCTAAVSVGGWSYTRGLLEAAEARAKAAEDGLRQERLQTARLAVEISGLAARSEDVGKGVGMLQLAFGAMFSQEALARFEKENPEILAFRRHLDDIAARNDEIRTRVASLAKALKDAEHKVGGAPSGNRARLDAVRQAKEALDELGRRMASWKEDGTFPGGRGYRDALERASGAAASLGVLEADIAKAVSQANDELFNGTPEIDVCLEDADRSLLKLASSHRQMVGDMKELSDRVMAALSEGYARTGLKGVLPAEKALAEAAAALEDAVRRYDALHAVFATVPIGVPLDEYFVTSGFGLRRHPILGNGRRHEGVDFAAPTGAPALTTASGTVVHAGGKGAYGLAVVVEHGNGVKSLYAHLSGIDVKEGQRVERGQPVGRVGSTGRSTGPHLHYEIMVGDEPRDPARFMRAAVLSTSCKRTESKQIATEDRNAVRQAQPKR